MVFTNFSILEASITNYLLLGTPTLKPRASPEVMLVVQEMMVKKFQSGQELGKNGQGILYPIHLPTQKGKAGLGYTGRSKRRNPYKKIPFQLSGILMPKVNNHSPNPAVQDDEEKILILLLEETAKRELSFRGEP